MLKLLLDGTFPIHLSRRLKDEGMNVERLIVVGRATETYITDRLSREDDAVFVTEDPGRKTLALENRGPVIISLVPQALPLEERLEPWARALASFAARRPPGRLFKILEDGQMIRVPLETVR